MFTKLTTVVAAALIGLSVHFSAPKTVHEEQTQLAADVRPITLA